VDLQENHGRVVSRCLIQDVADAVAAVALVKEEDWSDTLPKFDEPPATVAISLDGTCTLKCEDGWREAMVGTLAFYDRDGERQHTVYLATTPEYGKAKVLSHLGAEIGRAKTKCPDAHDVGIADGASGNWEFLGRHTDVQVVDYWHAAYLGKAALPKSWRLGSKPNLTQMHHDARTRVSPELIEAKLLKSIEALKSLTAGTSGEGYKVMVHNLPDKPNDITDDGDFHYAVLTPRAASTSGNPSAEARRFLDETTGPDRPRVYRNAVVLAVPSREGLEVARTRIRDYLGWEEVQSQLKGHEVDLIRQETLVANLGAARKKVPEAVQQAYNIVVTVSEANEVQAFKLTLDTTRPLFDQIKSDARSRIQETAVSYEALLPEGPYDLWRSGETSRRVKDPVGAFAQFPHLPKMLNRQAILDTLIQGCREGQFVLRITRPDRSYRTIWRATPDDADLKNTTMEVVLPESAELSGIEPGLLAPGVLPDLWKGEDVTVAEVRAYFSGGKVVKVARQGYDEAITIPKAPRRSWTARSPGRSKRASSG
jgi:hypothetical protein